VPGRSAVIWDFDGTLAERPGLWAGCLHEIVLQDNPGDPIRREDISALMHTGFPWHMPERAHPELCDPDAWWKAMTALLSGILERLGYPSSAAHKMASRVRGHYTDGRTTWRVFPATHESLQRLKGAGFRQVILSNHVPELDTLVDQLGLSSYFDGVITSARTGFEKPHEAAYAAARSSLPPEANLWMVGDNAEADVLAPERHGIRGILLWRKQLPPPQRVKRHAASLSSATDLILASPPV
jgi:putative hydrolase of the HAD superfamily